MLFRRKLSETRIPVRGARRAFVLGICAALLITNIKPVSAAVNDNVTIQRLQHYLTSIVELIGGAEDKPVYPADKEEFDEAGIIKKINYLAKQQDELSEKLASIKETIESSGGTDPTEPTSIPGEDLKPSEVDPETGEIKTYQFAGYEWAIAEVFEEYAVLQSTGVTAGYWPGYKMKGPTTGEGNWGGVNSRYTGDIDGADISGYDDKTSTLYASIKEAEYTSASYGKGLYLIKNTMAGLPVGKTDNTAEKYLTLTGSTKIYHDALKVAAKNYVAFGASYDAAWLGTDSDSYFAWYVYQSGSVNGNDSQDDSCVVAPAFNLDLSKVTIGGDVIEIK